jgi:hypothetical protein
MYNFISNLNNTKPVKMIIKENNYSGNSISNPIQGAKTCSLYSQPYLDLNNQCYKNIVVVNVKPKGPLGNFVRLVKFPVLSEFKQNYCNSNNLCGYALISLYEINNGNCSSSSLMDVNEIPDLISFLLENGYTIDTNITKMFNTSNIRFNTNIGNELICFITYNN